MLESFWRAVAWIVTRRRVTDYLILRAMRTPYFPITSRDGTDVYMDRWWLFNAYGKDADGNAGPPRWTWLPSIRIHHIMRPDDAPHMHDHPWNARTIVLQGHYLEERPLVRDHVFAPGAIGIRSPLVGEPRLTYLRETGYTGRVLFGSYHHISNVSNGGVFTLWFTWRYRGTWGFLVNGRKVPWREYLQ